MRYVVTFPIIVDSDSPVEAAEFAAAALHLPKDVDWGATVTPLRRLGALFAGFFVRYVAVRNNRETPPSQDEVTMRCKLA